VPAEHSGAVKIQVQCRRGGDPRSFLLGTCWLPVTRVLERAAENSLRRWRLAQVAPRAH
jgi:hypothetical protein